MAPYSLLAAALVASSVSALQIPINLPPQSGEHAPVVVSAPESDIGASKATIDTDALQALIRPDNLMSSAKELYEIAKLGEKQYGHPTRVIGSVGKPSSSISNLHSPPAVLTSFGQTLTTPPPRAHWHTRIHPENDQRPRFLLLPLNPELHSRKR